MDVELRDAVIELIEYAKWFCGCGAFFFLLRGLSGGEVKVNIKRDDAKVL